MHDFTYPFVFCLSYYFEKYIVSIDFYKRICNVKKLYCCLEAIKKIGSTTKAPRIMTMCSWQKIQSTEDLVE